MTSYTEVSIFHIFVNINYGDDIPKKKKVDIGLDDILLSKSDQTI
jgi:hypothetical protein